MKKRAFFLASLLLAIAALVAQAAGLYFILIAIGQGLGQAMMLTMPPFIFFPPAQPAQTQTHNGITSLLLLSGLVLAVLSLAGVVASFRRREPGWGWRIIPITMLALYVGTWLALFLG